MDVIATDGDYAIERRAEGGVDAYGLRQGGAPLDWPGFARGLREEAEVRALLTRALRDAPAKAYFWECCPWRAATPEPRLEFVLAPTSAFAGGRARPDAFREHFGQGDVARFDSLRGDARLVAPSPTGREDAALHLARFVRQAPPERVDALWVAVGEEIDVWRRAARGELWLSTSGLGVPWLHVRLDSRPKYYTHAAYR